MKLLRTVSDSFVVHDLVADAVLAFAADVIRHGAVRVITLPIQYDDGNRQAQILLSPATQLSSRTFDGPVLDLSADERDAIAALRLHDVEAIDADAFTDIPASAAFVDFGMWVQPRGR